MQLSTIFMKWGMFYRPTSRLPRECSSAPRMARVMMAQTALQTWMVDTVEVCSLARIR